MSRWRSAVALALLTAGCSTAGCSAAKAPADPPESAAPQGVSVVVQQYRSDQVSGRLQLSVVNAGQVALVVEQARLTTARLGAPPVWRPPPGGLPATVRPGLTVDLPVAPTAAACPVAPVPAPAVRLLLRAPSGSRSWVRVPATDPYDVLGRSQRAGCLRSAVLAVVAPAGRPLPSPVAGAATLVVRLVPTGAPGRVEVTGVGSTTLLTPAPDRAATGTAVVSAATGPVLLRVPVRPTRCDPHAVAEDKIGTLLRLAVRLTTAEGSSTGELTLPPTEEFRSSVYAFVAAACA